MDDGFRQFVLIVGLGIAAMNADAAREVWGARRAEGASGSRMSLSGFP